MSSNSVAISVRDLGKKYTIAHNPTRPTSLQEAIVPAAVVTKDNVDKYEKYAFN